MFKQFFYQSAYLDVIAVYPHKLCGVVCALVLSLALLTGCAQGVSPQTRNVNIPAPQTAEERRQAVNENADSVLYLPLGRDVLVPETVESDPLPTQDVGPFELRDETLGAALQLILADVDIPIAFSSNEGLTRTVTVSNLRGKLKDVVDQVCSLADLYCSFEKGSLVIKDKQTYTITIPPIGTSEDRDALLTSIAGAIKAITGFDPVVDGGSRTIVYEATSRTASQAERYFQRMRSNTALVVFETYIWEVSLNSGNTAGINWDAITGDETYRFGVNLSGSTDTDLGAPISIGLPTKGEVNLTTGDVVRFISNYGAVKTISQPQLTMLSGSAAKLRVADRQNYVSSITRTLQDNQTTVATQTDSVDTGFTLNITSGWDNATVYGTIDILLQEVRRIDTFDDNPDAIVQLPQTTEREVQTQVRVRPGDSLLIAGLVREVDNLDKSGLGAEKPVIPLGRTAKTNNIELVFLLRPRVVVFTDTAAKYHEDRAARKVAAEAVELDRGKAQTETPRPEPVAASSPLASVIKADISAPVDEKTAPAAVGASPAQESSMAPVSIVPDLFATPPESLKSAPPEPIQTPVATSAPAVTPQPKNMDGVISSLFDTPVVPMSPAMVDAITLAPDNASAAAISQKSEFLTPLPPAKKSTSKTGATP